jgi:hypothetical protein
MLYLLYLYLIIFNGICHLYVYKVIVHVYMYMSIFVCFSMVLCNPSMNNIIECMDQSLVEVTTRRREMKQVESQGIDTRARRDTVVLVKERSSELGGRDGGQ